MSCSRDWALAFMLSLSLAPEAHAGQPLPLADGRSVEILGIGPIHSANEGWTALRLEYRTPRTLSDEKALRTEADDIWDRFQVDADHGGYVAAIMTAYGPVTNESYGFTFEKLAGSWRTHETKERAQAKLDAEFVRDFVDRIDLVMHHNEMRSLQLYMADDWTVTISGSGVSPITYGREEFVASTFAAFSHASAIHHRREITNVAIGQDATSARVESRETEDLTTAQRTVADDDRSTDLFELRGDIMLWTRSMSVIEKRTETMADQ